jgi:hypothetical protein
LHPDIFSLGKLEVLASCRAIGKEGFSTHRVLLLSVTAKVRFHVLLEDLMGNAEEDNFHKAFF